MNPSVKKKVADDKIRQSGNSGESGQCCPSGRCCRFGRWWSWLTGALIGVSGVAALTCIIFATMALFGRLDDGVLIGANADDPRVRISYTQDGMMNTNIISAIPFGSGLGSRHIAISRFELDLRCLSNVLQNDIYVCDRYAISIVAPFRMLAGIFAILPVFAFLNGPVTRYLRAKRGLCRLCGATDH